MAEWQTIDTTVVYENPFMVVHEDNVLNPLGGKGIYGYVDSKSDSVYVVPVDDEGNTYIIDQYRYPVRHNSWECVAGRSDGQDYEIAARRELLEETGVEATIFTKLGDVEVANGITTFKSTFVLAQNIRKVTDELDQLDGIVEAKKLPLSKVIDMIMNSEITCSQSIAAFMMAREYLVREQSE